MTESQIVLAPDDVYTYTFTVYDAENEDLGDHRKAHTEGSVAPAGSVQTTSLAPRGRKACVRGGQELVTSPTGSISYGFQGQLVFQVPLERKLATISWWADSVHPPFRVEIVPNVLMRDSGVLCICTDEE